MSILLKNSIFVHIPKTAGKWATNAIINNVKGAKFIGDPIYDAHKPPLDIKLPQFGFSRHPEAWISSLWIHRARKKKNKFGKRFNWQNQYKLEKECKSYFYHLFYLKVCLNKGSILDYYQNFFNPENDIIFGKQELLAYELVRMLEFYNEDFDSDAILNAKDKVINPTNRRSKKVTTHRTNFIFRYFLERNHLEFYNLMNYPTLTIKSSINDL